MAHSIIQNIYDLENYIRFSFSDWLKNLRDSNINEFASFDDTQQESPLLHHHQNHGYWTRVRKLNHTSTFTIIDKQYIRIIEVLAKNIRIIECLLLSIQHFIIFVLWRGSKCVCFLWTIGVFSWDPVFNSINRCYRTIEDPLYNEFNIKLKLNTNRTVYTIWTINKFN